MSDWRYVRIRSWHAVRTPTRRRAQLAGRMFGIYLTLCGRTAVGQPLAELPAAKSCESCLRIANRQDET